MSKITMGHRSYGTPIIRGDISDVYIGNYTSIAQNVIVDCGWHHRPDFVTTYPLNVTFEKLKHLRGHPHTNGDVHIGNDVWIGEGAIIMSGVTIGDGAVIGTSSLVTKDVLPYQIVAGIPARHVRMRFSASQIAELLRIKWWDWDEEKVSGAAELLMQPDVDKFIKRYK